MLQSEILGLKRSQIDFKSRVIRLLNTKNDFARTVPMTKVAMEACAPAVKNPIHPFDTDSIFLVNPARMESTPPPVPKNPFKIF